jgi:hypothetical protein
MNTEDKEKVQLVVRQTNYTEEEALTKLQENENDAIKVIKAFHGLSTKSTEGATKSLNQEIYKQIRYKLDESMRNFNERNDKKMETNKQKI